jgi:hypothetical protein
MTRRLRAGWHLTFALAVLTFGLLPTSTPFTSPGVAYAQDLSVDPKSVSPAASDLRPGFQFVPEKSDQREPVPGIIVYEADFVRDQTPKNFKEGPIEIKSLVAKTANSQQAAEQFTSSRQALTTASPAWVESKVAKLGDEAIGLTMEGTSSEGAAVAHLFLFRRGAMVVGITVAGLTKPTKMSEAEAIAALVLRKIDPAYKSQTAPSTARPLNARGATGAGPGSSASAGSGSTAPMSTTGSGSATGGPRVRVANTGGTGVRMRAQPSTTAPIAGRLADGTVLEIVGEDKVADGHTWRNVRAPGDGRGWVASEYLVNVSGGTATTSSSGQPSTAQSAPAATGSPAASAAPASTGAATSSAASAGASTGATDVLKVEVSVKQAKVAPGAEQTVDITVTKGGQPVSGAQVTVKTSPTGETPTAPATDASGKTSVKWKPTGTPGFIGVGVSAVGADGVAGVGGASFQIGN